MDYSMELNNLGVQCLEAGYDIEVVLEIFRDSLTYTMKEEWEGHRQTNEGSATSSEVYQNKILLVKNALADSNMLKQGESRVLNSMESSLIYVKAFPVIKTLPRATSAVCHQDDVIEIVQSSTVLFNMALLYHLKATCQSGFCVAGTEKALSLYEMSLLLMREALGKTFGPELVCSEMILACLINMGQLQAESGRIESAQACARYSAQLMWSMQRYGSGLRIAEEDWNVLQLNALILHHRLQVAPAA